MVLSQSQKKQLHEAILEYFANNQFPKSAEAFSVQTDLSLDGIDPDGKKLENKWKSILNLQKKKELLEEKVKGLQQELAKYSNGNQPPNPNLEDLYIPKTPAKYQMRGHRNPITSMAFHPQFFQLATSSEDGTIKIWDTESGDYSRTLKGHSNPINCVNYDPNGKYLVSSSSDLYIKLWDLNNDYANCKTFSGHDHNVSFVNFVLDSDFIISCSRDKTIRLWEISTGYCKRKFTGHQAWVRKVVVSSDGKTLASCSDDQSVIIWNIEKETPVNRFFAHQNVIENIMLIEGEHSSQLMNSEFLKNKFTQESKMNALKQLQKEGMNGISNYQKTFIVTSSRDKLIRLFAVHSGELLHTFIGHDNWVRGLAMHPTGKYLYSASDDKTVRIWDLNIGREKKRIEAHEHFISSIHFHKKYGIIATGGNDLIVKIWHLK